MIYIMLINRYKITVQLWHCTCSSPLHAPATEQPLFSDQSQSPRNALKWQSLSKPTAAFVPGERLQLSSSHGLVNYCIKNVYEKTSAPKTYCKTRAIDSD